MQRRGAVCAIWLGVPGRKTALAHPIAHGRPVRHGMVKMQLNVFLLHCSGIQHNRRRRSLAHNRTSTRDRPVKILINASNESEHVAHTRNHHFNLTQARLFGTIPDGRLLDSPLHRNTSRIGSAGMLVFVQGTVQGTDRDWNEKKQFRVAHSIDPIARPKARSGEGKALAENGANFAAIL